MCKIPWPKIQWPKIQWPTIPWITSDRITAVATMIGSLVIPLVLFYLGHNYTEQQKQADAAQLNQQRKADAARLNQQHEADAAQRNVDRIAVLLSNLASNNPKERILALRFVDYLIQNKLFPKELSLEDLLFDAVKDENKDVARAASQVLTQAVNSDLELKQSVEKAAETNPETKQTLIRATRLIPGLRSYVNVQGVQVPSPVPSDTPPEGATARCRDGTYSFSINRSGTCSHHGGVAEWLKQ